MEVVGSTLNRQPSQGFAAILALSDAVWRSGSPAPSLRCPLRTSTCVEINQCDGCILSATTWPRWLRQAVRNRHRHAIKQVSRRWRGGRRGDSGRTRRKFDFHTDLYDRSEASRVEAEAPQ
jgi:hypothetical protein